MGVMLGFISNYGTVTIVLFGIVTAVLLLRNGIELSNQKERLEEVLKRRNYIYTLNAESGEMEENEDESASVTPDTIRKYETEFNKKCSWHDVLVQCIPVFPLLGILGTVAGLMLELQAGDINAMLESLDVALDTTFWGLLFAILLKMIEAVFPARIISDVEVMLEDFEKKLDLAEMFRKLKEEN